MPSHKPIRAGEGRRAGSSTASKAGSLGKGILHSDLLLLLEEKVENSYFRHGCHSTTPARTYPDEHPCVASREHPALTLRTRCTQVFFGYPGVCGSIRYQVRRSTDAQQLRPDLPTWHPLPAAPPAPASLGRARTRPVARQRLRGRRSTQPVTCRTQELLLLGLTDLSPRQCRGSEPGS